MCLYSSVYGLVVWLFFLMSRYFQKYLLFSWFEAGIKFATPNVLPAAPTIIGRLDGTCTARRITLSIFNTLHNEFHLRKIIKKKNNQTIKSAKLYIASKSRIVYALMYLAYDLD